MLVRKDGYLDETMNAQFILGQTFNFSPTLRALGNVENMKTVGKMSKLFGKKGQADQGTISTVGLDGICALFGIEGDPSRAARRALSINALSDFAVTISPPASNDPGPFP